MSQLLRYWIGDAEHCRQIPDAEKEVMPGVLWGEPWQLFTPAYWLSQLWMANLDQVAESPYRARGSLAEELTFCLLGGHGITAELATAAFQACCSEKLISNLETSAEKWEATLLRPLLLNERSIRYRYPRQKARFLSSAMGFLRTNSLAEHSGRQLRDALLTITGVGPKTAGWVARNYLDTDEVAILDIHLVRAGLLCNLFVPEQRVERDYFVMEDRYIKFCRALEVRPSVLDCLIWDQMRAYGKIALTALNTNQSMPKQSKYSRITNRQMELSLPI